MSADARQVRRARRGGRHSVGAVLFDLDGTLTDRPATVAAFAAAFVARFGAALDFGRGAAAGVVASAVASADGGGYRPRAAVFAHLRRALPWTRPPREGELAAFWAEAFPASTRPAAGLHSTLADLRRRGVRLGVVTNGAAATQRRKLETLGIARYLSAVVISGAVGVAKPDPRIFQLALDAIGTRAGASWFVGDHPMADVLGARAAGLTAVWRRGTHPWPAGGAMPPAMRIDRLADLLPLVAAGRESGTAAVGG